MPAVRGHAKKRADTISRFVTFVILFAFWLLFSGKYDVFHITLGIFSCALVAYASHDLLFEDILSKNKGKKTWRFALYIPWLIYQVVLANIHVAYLVFNPKAIDPEIVRYKSRLNNDFSKVTFANSITLTPGTITMDIVGDEFLVHALSKKVADDLNTGEMEDRVARVFLQDTDKKA